MNQTINIAYEDKNYTFFTILLFTMSILLHQSGVIFGFNISLADIFCFVIALLLIFNNKFIYPAIPVIYFLIVSIVVIVTALFYVPIHFNYFPSYRTVVSDYIKLLAIFMYFLLGYNLLILNKMKTLVKYYSSFGIMIGALGILLTLLNIQIFREYLFFADIRFKGLMIDPNYFAILQITSMVYFLRTKNMGTLIKFGVMLIVLLSVLVSGSKTGLIAFMCYLIFISFELHVYLKRRTMMLLAQFFLMGLLLLMLPLMIHTVNEYFATFASKIPSLSRVQTLFIDFSGAISASGSERSAMWNSALQIIKLSPLVGIGIGTYTGLSYELFHVDNVAHNTFLQLLAEWGIPLTLIFLVYVLNNLRLVSTKKHSVKLDNLVYRDIIIILLIGSMAITLNNARILWLILGALVATLKQPLDHKN